MTNFRFFEESLTDLRAYRVMDRWYWQCVTKPEIRPHLAVQRERESDNIFGEVRGSHVMGDANRIGLAQVAEQFNVILPPDVDDFYRRWDGGLLLFQQPYLLLSANEIIKTAVEFRELRQGQEPANLPWHLLRFCNVGNGNYLAFRQRRQRTNWEVIFASVEELDVDLLYDREDLNEVVLDSDFSSWLHRMCKSDGWPIDKEGDSFWELPAERI